LWGTSVLNIIGRVAGRGRRIGYPHRFAGLLRSGPTEYGNQGDIAANLALLEAAGVSAPNAGSPALMVAQAERDMAQSLLVSHGRRPHHPLVVIHSGSDWACQQWLPERWAQVADRIAAEHDADIVFTGLAGERQYTDQIRRCMASTSISVAGETSLLELAAVISQADLCVSVDSAAHDLAQALGVPAVVIAGPTVPEAPPSRSLTVLNRTSLLNRQTILGCQARFPLGVCHDYSCPFAGLKNISVDRVLDVIARSGCIPNGSTAPAAGSTPSRLLVRESR
jgi:ADP-heptose:LPS heptosyltransferase